MDEAIARGQSFLDGAAEQSINRFTNGWPEPGLIQAALHPVPAFDPNDEWFD